jgi:hypothetical protein
MRSGHLAGAILIAPILALITSLPAHADKIDGEWCASDGKRLSIDGPAITTPGGIRIKGNYSRHHFSYVVPERETGAGDTVEMSLQNENEVLILPHPGAELELWRRCPASV